VALAITDVSEERIASIIRIKITPNVGGGEKFLRNVGPSKSNAASHTR
jgi:hypothetical protein